MNTGRKLAVLIQKHDRNLTIAARWKLLILNDNVQRSDSNNRETKERVPDIVLSELPRGLPNKSSP